MTAHEFVVKVTDEELKMKRLFGYTGTEIIRCKDCVSGKPIEGHPDILLCIENSRHTGLDGFCCWAERKEE